ncbi:EAL domain-containing protein [uncultured Sphingomonas sp.]|uniref:EAL domain-containing protein n=1 Tax=uncultured Sphingomonas sp. TaxID=158754 RepID=UPI0035CAA2C4
MSQGDDAAEGRPVFLAFGEAVTRRADLKPFGWSVIDGEGPDPAAAFLDGPVQIALADLSGLDRLPTGWRALSRAVARRGGALVATGAAPLLREALGVGATHAAVDPSAETLALILASAAVHVARLEASDRDWPGEASGWAGPGGALARVDAVLADGHDAPVLLVALERFEVVNAAWGRAVGDQVLGSAARRIAQAAADALGAAAMVLRVAGSEFLVVPDRVAQRPADVGPLVASGIAARLSEPFVAAGATVSVGHRIALTAPVTGENGMALLDRLREQVQAARADAPPADDGPDALAVDLHHAIERGEVELLFQPQVTLSDARIVGVEALARWAHPRLGTLGAEPLLAAAARGGLSGALSAHIQTLALRQAAAWTGPLARLRLAINVTAQDIAAPGFADRVLARVAASGFQADRLTVEVTETGLILDLDTAAAALAGLRAAGCRVALDDFGTGYSSLAYLKALPIDYLKIDKAITRDVTGSARDRAVLDGVVSIARALGLGTIVEGVETVEQRDRLAALGCDLYQGFLCAEPIGIDALARLLEDR